MAKRRRYLINPRFQLRWTLIITAIGGLTAAGFSAVLWVKLGDQDRLLEQAAKGDEQLRAQSLDVVVLLMNLPETSAAETAKHQRRFDKINQTFDQSARDKAALRDHHRRLRYWIAAVVAVITLALFVWGIVVTHRVAGPLHVLKKHLKTLQATGKLDDRRPLRGTDDDDLRDLYDAVWDSLEEFTTRVGMHEPK